MGRERRAKPAIESAVLELRLEGQSGRDSSTHALSPADREIVANLSHTLGNIADVLASSPQLMSIEMPFGT